MSNLDYRKQIKETESKLLNLERKQSHALLRDRMRFLRLLKTGECSSQAKAGQMICLSVIGAEKLWKKYRSIGLEGLLDYPFKGRKQKLDDHSKQALIDELGKDSTQSLQQACAFVEEHSGVHYTLSGMHHALKRLKIKKKTGRPVHYQKDERGEKRFKKRVQGYKEALWQPADLF